ncbi:hypothetical protein FRB96_001030 [Tulasnella sp. 330]|nr:hypothetical protein FRB96_001030 [Tulasnella sp. 330]
MRCFVVHGGGEKVDRTPKSLAATGNHTDAAARNFYRPNYPRLQKLKQKHDPGTTFNKPLFARPARSGRALTGQIVEGLLKM